MARPPIHSRVAATHFLVEHKAANGWRVVARIWSTGPHAAQMAVSRASRATGIHRVRRLDDPGAAAQLFDVPPWGLPVPVEE
jgi:hypothetical protein